MLRASVVPNDIVNLLLGPAGTLVFALVVLFGGWKRWWVFGWAYRDVLKDRDEWKEAALRGTRVAERTIALHEKGRKDAP
jgi:Mn2+/Fe2+ NRAMP family transporter